MPTSAAGSKPCHPRSSAGQQGFDPAALSARRPSRQATAAATGFTLIELMVVVMLMAVATAGAVLSLRDSDSDALERDAQRLAAVLEAARARARANDARVVWQAQEAGFVLRGLPQAEPAQAWLSGSTRARSSAPVVLGPEPLIAPQRIELYSAKQPAQPVWVVTDGLRPFAVQRHAPGSRP